MNASSPASAPVVDRRLLKKVAAASFIGNFIEWFDYASYGYLATVIAVAFFPNSSPTAALLATWAVFAISFFIRPVGAVVWGHLGDKLGRRWALAWSILIMSASTFLIAFIPSYASIGLFAPLLLLLLRLVQGFSASGEYAGAGAFLAEYAPKEKRGLYTSLVPASTAAGLLFGSLFVTVLTVLFSHDQMTSWGWRLPFLLAGPLGLIGRYIRVHLEDTPQFRELEEQEEVLKSPFRETITAHRGRVLIGIGVTCLNAVGFYTILSYMPTYLKTEIGVSEAHANIATTISLLVYIGLIFIMGHLSDKFGRKRLLIVASVLFMIFTVPLFGAYQYVGFAGILGVMICFGALLAMNDGNLASFLSELFPTRVRYTGFAFSFNFANAAFGGTAPFVATALIAASGSELAPGWYLMVAAAVALIAMILSTETAGRELMHE